ncbi:hypothetical protein H696_06005 [Fonticula alba]|uniref:Rhodanese domain-containing protein n=1 Tax=Fonticula alba TaxID=691883 RepID=A0A058YZU5_FONAL|nr:hypothetical protein H696_06005 [Fonticula alba]KCV67485.1 hypothetical protein H696_06005 [Fonticula alba]|eukprot:XP_009498046.1 hypothetical protein H696_06005 [Fonticula alba]
MKAAMRAGRSLAGLTARSAAAGFSSASGSPGSLAPWTEAAVPRTVDALESYYADAVEELADQAAGPSGQPASLPTLEHALLQFHDRHRYFSLAAVDQLLEPAEPAPAEITPLLARAALHNDGPWQALLLDVRPMPARQALRLPGAVPLSMEQLQDRQLMLDLVREHARQRGFPLSSSHAEPGISPREVPIVVSCQAGVRSLTGAQILRDAGFTRAISLQGGLNLWATLNLPVEACPPPDDKA